MKKSQNFNQDKITLRDIKEKLRSMPELEPPVKLQEKLLKAIPQKRTEDVTVRSFRPRLGIWGLGASAAMILIMSMIFVLNLNPSVPSHKMVIDLNDTATNFTSDLNDPFIKDSNYVSYFIQGKNMHKASAIFQN